MGEKPIYSFYNKSKDKVKSGIFKPLITHNLS